MIGCLRRADFTGAELFFTWEEIEAIRAALDYSGTMQLSKRNTEAAWALTQMMNRYANGSGAQT